MEKQRIDVLLLERGLVKSREKAKALIMAGQVLVDGKAVTKAGEMVALDRQLAIKEDSCPFVSRGGLKLEKAVHCFDVSLQNKICADIGASTGGFTDCMLRHGAVKVYAVDVGYGQLDWKLRNDSRVIVMERTNARYLTSEQFDSKIEFASVDVSFISLRLILPVLKELGILEVVTLIKPQFEAGRDKVGKRGVVRDASVHEEVITEIFEFAKKIGYFPLGLDFSPVKGPNGNIEYIAYYKMEQELQTGASALSIHAIVEKAHAALD